ncbi:hypothetical protein VPHK469_0174 [Vibrio phage K469]
MKQVHIRHTIPSIGSQIDGDFAGQYDLNHKDLVTDVFVNGQHNGTIKRGVIPNGNPEFKVNIWQPTDGVTKPVQVPSGLGLTAHKASQQLVEFITDYIN